MFIDEGDFHASAFIVGPEETTVLIRDKRKNNPLWKFPGGKKQLIQPLGKRRRGEHPLETVIREVHEETGLWIRKNRTEPVISFDKGSYRKHVFITRITSLRGLVPLSNEYEEAKVFSLEDMLWLPDFHPWYRECYLTHIKSLL
jgi:8-oxo-dGTP pyrophosphatase MutT (NUDIX family)